MCVCVCLCVFLYVCVCISACMGVDLCECPCLQMHVMTSHTKLINSYRDKSHPSTSLLPLVILVMCLPEGSVSVTPITPMFCVVMLTTDTYLSE